jgi:uncharacterized protein (TIGR03067 family)
MPPRLVFAVLALAGLTAFAPSPFPRKAKRGGGELSLAVLQGHWKVEKVERTTKGAYRVVTDPVTHILVEKDVWVFLHGQGKRSGEYRLLLDAKKKPAWFTFRPRAANQGGTEGLMTRPDPERIKVLYQWGKPRPASFDNPPAEYWAITLIRAK